jgi:hypothetical protein
MEDIDIKNVSIQEAKESNDDGVITNLDITPKKTSTKNKKSGSAVSVGNDVIGSAGAERKTTSEAPAKKVENDTVAIHSTKNADWRGVGSIVKGYNIVSVLQSEKWLTRNHVRLATPEEVAREFGA